MNQRQAFAYSNPCARAVETCARHFHRDCTVDGALLSTILTVNK